MRKTHGSTGKALKQCERQVRHGVKPVANETVQSCAGGYWLYRVVTKCALITAMLLVWSALLPAQAKQGGKATTSSPKARGQSAKPGTAATTVAPVTGGTPSSQPDKAASPLEPKVVASNGSINTNAEMALGQQLTVCLNGLREWASVPGNDPGKLRLFLAGVMIKQVPPVPVPAQNYLNFTLKIDSADKDERDAWAQIVNAARHSVGNKVPVSVGLLDKGQPFESDVFVMFHIYPGYAPWVGAGLIALLCGLLYLGVQSNLLRDSSQASPPPPARAPISLGRVQMAWWFYLVIASYLYIWLVTGQSYAPTGSVLALMGISAVTGLAGAVVDKGKVDEAVSKRTALMVEQTALGDRIPEIEKASPPAASELAAELEKKKTRLAEVKAQLATGPRLPAPSVSQGILKDLLGAGEGISFHRFQIAIWTVVLGVVFIVSVHRDLAMPEFDATLLGLMGLSSGTYLGFKFPEKPK